MKQRKRQKNIPKIVSSVLVGSSAEKNIINQTFQLSALFIFTNNSICDNLFMCSDD